MNVGLPAVPLATCSLSEARLGPRRSDYVVFWGVPSGMEGTLTWESLRASDVAVKKRSELGLRQRAHPRRFDVAVLEQHQRRDAADAELRRHRLVLVDVDLRDLQPPFILLRHLVEDRRDRLARAAPFRPVVD